MCTESFIKYSEQNNVRRKFYQILGLNVLTHLTKWLKSLPLMIEIHKIIHSKYDFEKNTKVIYLGSGEYVAYFDDLWIWYLLTGSPKTVEHLLKLDGAKERLHLFKAYLLDEGSFDIGVMQWLWNFKWPYLWCIRGWCRLYISYISHVICSFTHTHACIVRPNNLFWLLCSVCFSSNLTTTFILEIETTSLIFLSFCFKIYIWLFYC